MKPLTGKEWLAANDPTYVSPQAKAAKTREIPFSPDALGALLGGQGTVKSHGKYQQRLLVGFGESEGDMIPTFNPTQAIDLMLARQNQEPKRCRGKRGGRKHK